MLVRKSDLRDSRFQAGPPQIGEGQVLLRPNRFALTSNNVTYAVAGEPFGYWKFFPAEEGWGRVPVWGFADVEASRSPELKQGERVWGYFPISSHLVVTPTRVTARSFVDGAAHRTPLPPVYNQYERVSADPSYRREDEGFTALFRPLFMTGFLIDVFLAKNDFFGARRVLVSSASSKTSLGLASQLHRRGGAVEVVGLTAAANAPFVERTGFYDRVVPYDALGALPNDAPALLVDIAGDAPVIDRLAERLGDKFVYNCMVGGTHWEARPGETKGPPRTLFFAPDHMDVRDQPDFQTRFAEAWRGFADSSAAWLNIVEESGEQAVRARWLALLDGKARPEDGYVLSL
jgi:hypothetical protein